MLRDHDSSSCLFLDIFLLFCISNSVQDLCLDVTTYLDSYTWNYRELATHLTQSEMLAVNGLEPLTISSMHKYLAIELS